jgi:hypothetical protein
VPHLEPLPDHFLQVLLILQKGNYIITFPLTAVLQIINSPMVNFLFTSIWTKFLRMARFVDDLVISKISLLDEISVQGPWPYAGN